MELREFAEKHLTPDSTNPAHKKMLAFKALSEHSDELTENEFAKCVDFIEGGFDFKVLEPKFAASVIQEMLNVADYEVIALGYTFDRKTVEISFRDKQLVREIDGETEMSWEFNPDFFFAGIKRWYLGTKERGLNHTLMSLFETFGHRLETVKGGIYPPK